MKVRNILLVLLLMEVGLQAAWAQTMVLHRTNGQTIEYEVSDLDSIVFVEKNVRLVTKIELSETSVILHPGETQSLTAIVLPEDANNKSLAWESSSERVATVSQTGMVTAVGSGRCSITAKATDGSGVKSTCVVTVEYEGVSPGLPVSTMLSPEIQWSADIMVFKKVEWHGTDAAGQTIETPLSDANGNEWYAPDYQLTDGQESWSVGYSPFLSEEFDEETEVIPWIIWPNSTRWSTGQDVADIYLRRTFTIDHELSDRVFLSCCHDDNAEWYLNGVLIYSVIGYDWDYSSYNEQVFLTAEQRALIHTDGKENVLAIHTHNYGGPALADGGLYEKEIGLPTSTMLSPKTQWVADMMVFNDSTKYDPDNIEVSSQIVGVPPTDTNGNNWYSPDYELTNGQKSWSLGYSPLLSEKHDDIGVDWIIWPNSTVWSADKEVADIYLRRTFTVNRELSNNIFLSCCYDNGAEWYLNGVLIHSTEAGTWSYDKYEKVYLTPEQRALIYTDGRENVFAIHVHNDGGPGLADGGLYEEGYSDGNH